MADTARATPQHATDMELNKRAATGEGSPSWPEAALRSHSPARRTRTTSEFISPVSERPAPYLFPMELCRRIQ
jgi:hypothetical protein